ncbi:MAG: hypothetical protein AB1608_01570 [Thermoproteota archaeon]
MKEVRELNRGTRNLRDLQWNVDESLGINEDTFDKLEDNEDDYHGTLSKLDVKE